MLATFRMAQVAKFYLIIPVLAVACLIDFYFFNEGLKKALPTQIESLLILNLLFNLPHILASEITLARKEYIQTYIQPILILVILCCVFTVVFTILFPDSVLLWFAILTIAHVVGQQFGLCASLANVPLRLFNLWKYLGIILGIFQYLKIYKVRLPISDNVAMNLFWILSTVFSIMAVYLFFKQKNKEGRQLTLGNWAIVMTPAFFLQLGYPVFTSFIPRFVHDVTAFYAYYVHNYNVRQEKNDSGKRMEAFQFLTLVCFTFLIPVVLAAPFTLGWLGHYGVMFTLMASLFHYGIEGYVWRRGFKPRKYLNI